MEIKVKICPFCDGTEFVTGRQNDYGAVMGESIWTGEALYHQICRRCGSIVRSYVKDPEKLLKKKNRK